MMNFFKWTKSKSKDESGLIGGAILIGLSTASFLVAATTWSAFAIWAVAAVVAAAAYAYSDSMMPSMASSPTYASDSIQNTVSEGVYVARCYGRCRIGGNKLRYGPKNGGDKRIIVGHCVGPVSGVQTYYVNDIPWAELTGGSSKTEYTGTRTQSPDARFTAYDRPASYRGIAYTAFTFGLQDQQIGYDPNVTVIMDGLLCTPLAGGADAFTRNPAVILYDWYLNVEGYAAGDLDLNAFKSLEAFCDAVPVDGTIARYRFDFNFDTNMAINDAKKIIWASFNGFAVKSQGKIKPIWDSAQMADGSGGLTAKTVSHAFDLDNIVKDSFTWNEIEKPNLVRIHYKDPDNKYASASVEEKDEIDIDLNGEILYEETAWFITDAEIARRRAKFKFGKKRYPDYQAEFTALSGASDLEVLDLVTITHSLPGWTTKQFLVLSRAEDELGRMKFMCEAYYPGIYDDKQTGTQAGFPSELPNPYQTPPASTAISSSMVALGNPYDFDSVRVSFTPPATDPFYSYSEFYASNDDATYYYVGIDGGGEFTFNGLGVIYAPGETCYIKLRSVNEMGVKEAIPAAADTSVVITATMRIGSFFAGTYDFWGGNASIAHADTTIVLGNLDGTSKLALGASADSITYAGTQSGFMVDGAGYLRAGGVQSLKWNPITSILTIGEWIVSPNGIASNFTENSAAILLDKTNTLIRLGVTSGDYITMDGANLRVRSSNYVAGVAGAGFTLEPDLLEVGNIASRGIIRTAVFQKDVVSAVGGNLAVLPADILETDMTAADGTSLTRITEASDTRITEAGDTRVTEAGIYDMVIAGNETFAVGDILRIKDGLDDEWLEVLLASAPTYRVERDKAGVYASGSNPTWQKGASVINYKQSGDGGVYMTSSDTNAPYLSIFTHAGAPWSAITTNVREGNLNGYAGYVTDTYGWASYIDANNYIKIDAANGIRMSGDIVITGGSGIANLSDAGLLVTADSLDDVPDGLNWGRVAITSIQAGRIIISGLGDEITEKMFTDPSSRENIEAWRSTTNTAFIDGGFIFANTITANQFISTLYGDMNQAMSYVKTVLGAGDEYNLTLTDTHMSSGTPTTIDADTHADYGVSIRLATATLWDEVGAVWDTGTWDIPTEAAGNWISEVFDFGANKSLQMAMQFTIVEDVPASTAAVITITYSLNGTDFGTNAGVFDDANWETMTQAQVTGDIYKASGSLFTFRYFKIKVALETSDTDDRIILHTMTLLGNLINLFSYRFNVTIAAGGTVIPLTGFNAAPGVTVTAVGATPLVPMISAESASSVTVHLYNLAGADVGGTGNLAIIGV